MGFGCRREVISRYKAGEGCVVGVVDKKLRGVVVVVLQEEYIIGVSYI